MLEVNPLIDRLERWLTSHRRDYYDLLRPGATNEQLNAFETKFALKLPPAFRALYRWRNGQDPLSSLPLQLNQTFSPLDAVAETKELLDGMIGNDFENPKYWRRGWVPFLHNGAGSYLCLDVAAEDGGTPGQLVSFWKADPDRPIEFPNVETWLAALVSSMEDGSLKLS